MTKGGVGGYNMMVRFGDDLKAAAAAPVSSRLPAESRDTAAYCAVASAADDLGNESPLPDTTVSCRTAPAAADRLIDHDDDPRTDMVYGQIDEADSVPIVAEQHLEFGVDTTRPAVEFAEDYDEERRYATAPVTFAFESDDDGSEVANSGLDGDAGVVAGIQRRTAAKTECLVIADDGSVAADAPVDRYCEASVIGDMNVTLGAGAAAAYYRLHARAKDKAGNRSHTLRHTFVHDDAKAVATAPVVPGTVGASETFAVTSVLNDNLSIRDYYITADFGDLFSLGAGGPVGVDGFNSLELTNLNHPARVVVDAYAGLQAAVGGRVQKLDGVSVYVRDQAQEDYGDGQETRITVTDPPTSRSHGFQRGAFNTGWVGRDDLGVYAFCGIPVCEDEDAALAVEIEFRAIARAAGPFPNPFERVDFWMSDVNGASWFFGSDATGTSGQKGSDGAFDFFPDDDHFPTWSFSIIVPGTLLAAVARTDTNEGSATAPLIRAIGVNEYEVGVVTSTGVAIDMTEPDPGN